MWVEEELCWSLIRSSIDVHPHREGLLGCVPGQGFVSGAQPVVCGWQICFGSMGQMLVRPGKAAGSL